MTWDWNDIRVFLAVLREGSTLRAAERLAINQTTCARRIAALESALGLKLFEKAAGGYLPTAAALELREAAERIEAAAQGFQSLADAERRTDGRVFRITASTYFANAVAAAIRRLREEDPAILVETDLSDAVRDLGAGEADLAIRGGNRPIADGLVMRQLWSENGALCCSADYAARFGKPTPDDLSQHSIVMLAGPAHEAAVAAGFGPSIKQIANSMDGLIAAIRSGAFVGVLPDSILRLESDLIRCVDIPLTDIGAWIVFPERWRDDAVHQRLRQLLAEEMLAAVGR